MTAMETLMKTSLASGTQMPTTMDTAIPTSYSQNAIRQVATSPTIPTRDGTADVNPSASEVCNDIDDDCDTLIDDEDADLIDATTWYIDYDSDGFGSSSYTVDSCDAPTGYVGTDDDCDDTDASVYPSAPELYDDQDNDCDGAADEDLWTGTGIDGSLSVSTDTNLSTDASGTRSEPDAVAYGLLTISGSSLILMLTRTVCRPAMK